jgi:hypothetical protein
MKGVGKEIGKNKGRRKDKTGIDKRKNTKNKPTLIEEKERKYEGKYLLLK